MKSRTKKRKKPAAEPLDPYLDSVEHLRRLAIALRTFKDERLDVIPLIDDIGSVYTRKIDFAKRIAKARREGTLTSRMPQLEVLAAQIDRDCQQLYDRSRKILEELREADPC